MFKKLFGKKKEATQDNGTSIKSPMTGKLLDISETPDDVFAQKMLGDGVAIDPTEGVVCSPVDGEIVQLFLPSKHAVGIKSNDGVEILIHIGLDTVKMNGEGFEALVAQGDKVTAGQELIKFDIEKIREKAKSTITPVVITNMDAISGFDVVASGDITVKENLLNLKK